jgi:pyruvate dehydrogenase phosphatase
MIGKKLFEFGSKPLGFINAFRGSLWPSFSISNALKEHEQKNNKNQENVDDKEDEEPKDKDNKEKYRFYDRETKYSTVSAIFPFLVYMTNKLSGVSHSLFKGEKHEKNKLKNRITLIQYPANNPIEDRWSIHQLESLEGFVTIVLDGHGGWQVAEYAKENLAKEIDKCLKANKGKYPSEDEYISASLRDAFDNVENGFLQIARDAYRIGFPGTGHVGACALAAIVYNNKIYAANIGDCKGVVANAQGKQVTLRKINHKLNANSKKEQARLRSSFKDSDIFVCRRGDNKSCYVKNALQPTRAFGDFRLKHPEFNNPRDLSMDFGYRRKIENFNGPYITHVPDIKVINLEKGDKYLILSSDGMWDELNKDDVSKIVQSKGGDKKDLVEDLLNTSIRKAAKEANISESEIRGLAPGHRRSLHDDMTIIVVDLENQI